MKGDDSKITKKILDDAIYKLKGMKNYRIPQK